MLALETRAKMALAGPANLHGIASNWLRAAADSQQPAVMLYPPVLPVPQLARLGLYQLDAGKPAAALETFQDALRRYPNDLTTLDGLVRAHEALKQPAEAAAARKLILQIRTPG
jgi:predicted Zn-dependent protease